MKKSGLFKVINRGTVGYGTGILGRAKKKVGFLKSIKTFLGKIRRFYVNNKWCESHQEKYGRARLTCVTLIHLAERKSVSVEQKYYSQSDRLWPWDVKITHNHFICSAKSMLIVNLKTANTEPC